jgi:hypothetical protein
VEKSALPGLSLKVSALYLENQATDRLLEDIRSFTAAVTRINISSCAGSWRRPVERYLVSVDALERNTQLPIWSVSAALAHRSPTPSAPPPQFEHHESKPREGILEYAASKMRMKVTEE